MFKTRRGLLQQTSFSNFFASHLGSLEDISFTKTSSIDFFQPFPPLLLLLYSILYIEYDGKYHRSFAFYLLISAMYSYNYYK